MASRILEQPVKKIGNYEVIDLLSAGGMSHVYKARHATTGELVATFRPAAWACWSLDASNRAPSCA
jgi:hypothetical protein